MFLQEGFPKQVRMAHLACIGSRKVNGVAELHSELVRTTILKDFVDFEGISKCVQFNDDAQKLMNNLLGSAMSRTEVSLRSEEHFFCIDCLPPFSYSSSLAWSVQPRIERSHYEDA